jgi:hypothetical protein
VTNDLKILFFLCALFGKFYVQSDLFKKKIPCPFSVLDKTLKIVNNLVDVHAEHILTVSSTPHHEEDSNSQL